MELGGKNFCVSHAHPNDVLCCHQIGQSVMLDCGSFSAWTQGREVDWDKYYDWCGEWLSYNTTWAIIPDIINSTAEANDELLSQWPYGKKQGSPAWHLHEPLDRVLRLLDAGYQIISFGSSGEYSTVGTDRWHHRMTEVFNMLSQRGPIPWIHMLRGMSLSGSHYPFSSVDSTDVARNHNRKQNSALVMANRWDALQCSPSWSPLPLQVEALDGQDHSWVNQGACCRTCATDEQKVSRMIVCPKCGDKRCPKADNHTEACVEAMS